MFKWLRRNGRESGLRGLQSFVPQINALERELEQHDDAVLQGKTGEFRARLARGEALDDLLVDAFAVVREASRRVLGQRHHDVQLLGGAALHLGWVAEMKTGEGKTLASTLPAYLNALEGEGVHMITANDYLAARDAQMMGRVYRWLGLSVGLLVPSEQDIGRSREQYAADVTYGYGKTFGYDYLWDHITRDPRRQRQRGQHVAIVDDADAVLLDHTRSPLQIARGVGDPLNRYPHFASIARALERGVHYKVDEIANVVLPTSEGIAHIERAFGVDNLYSGQENDLLEHLQLALQAKELFRRDEHYLVRDGEVRAIDEHTGRIREARWSGGVHQAVEAKEGLTVKAEKRKVAEISLRNYLLLYSKLAGLTGTAMADEAELRMTYGLEVVTIPTHRPVARVDRIDRVYKTEEGMLDAAVACIAERHKTGQPVLVGTPSVEASETLAGQLEDRGVPFRLLNAKEHAKEAPIVAQAGRLGAVTVTTNMAGRGVDILLGGNPEVLACEDLRARDLDPDDAANAEELHEAVQRYTAETTRERREVLDLGGLYVLGTDRHHSRRLDDQLRGRSGRQGEPGESCFYLSFESSLLRANSKFAAKILPEDQPVDTARVARAIERIQASMALARAKQRQEENAYEDVVDEQRKVIYALWEEAVSALWDAARHIAEGREISDTPDGLRPQIVGQFLPDAVAALVEAHCAEENPRDWDLEALGAELRTLWPSTLAAEDLATAHDLNALRSKVTGEARRHYERQEARLTPPELRIVECRATFDAIDRCWPAHLAEMAYLREGITWRRFDTDSLHAWNKEGFEMFDRMMSEIYRNIVRAVMHEEPEVPEARVDQVTA